MDVSTRREVLDLFRELDAPSHWWEEEESLMHALKVPGEKRSEILSWTLCPLMKMPHEGSKMSPDVRMEKFLASFALPEASEFLEGTGKRPPLLVWKTLLQLRQAQSAAVPDVFLEKKKAGDSILLEERPKDEMNFKTLIEELAPSLTSLLGPKRKGKSSLKSTKHLPSLISKDIPIESVISPSLEDLRLMQVTCNATLEEKKTEMTLKQEDGSYAHLENSIKHWSSGLEALSDSAFLLKDFQDHYDVELKSWINHCSGKDGVDSDSEAALRESLVAYDFFNDLSALKSSLNHSLKFNTNCDDDK